MTEETLFQQLVENSVANEMADDLEEIDWDEEDRISVQVPLRESDVPRVVKQLREMPDADSSGD